MTKYEVVCPRCFNKTLELTVTKKGSSQEICDCGFPANEKIYEIEVTK